MKKISKEEAEKFDVREGGWSKLRTHLMNMKKDEILHVTRAEVPVKRGPFNTISRISSSVRKYSVKTIGDKSGWLIERVK